MNDYLNAAVMEREDNQILKICAEKRTSSSLVSSTMEHYLDGSVLKAGDNMT